VTITPSTTPDLSSSNAPESEYNGAPAFTICAPGVQSFDFTFNGAGPNIPGAIHTVSWGNGNNSTYSTSNWSATQTYSLGLSEGVYTITELNGCISTTPFYVFVGDVPLGGLAVVTPSICTGGAIDFSWSGYVTNPPGTLYIIDYGDGNIDTLPHPPPPIIQHIYTESSCSQPNGEYTAEWEISNPCDERTGSINQIRVSEQPLADFSIAPNDTICIGTPVTLTDLSTGQQAPQCADPNHIWTISPGTYSLLSGTLGSTNGFPVLPGQWTSGSDALTVQFNAAGTYTINDMVGNGCGTNDLSLTICVEGPPEPNFTLSPLVGCSPLVVNSTNNSVLNGCDVTRTWEATQLTQGCAPQPGSIAFNAQANAPQFTFTGQGTYEVTLTLENTCGEFEQTIAPITVNGPPILDQATLPIICAGQGCVTPTAVSQNCSSPITAYAWTFPGGAPANSNQQSPGQVCYSTPGSYAVTASATNACGTATDVVNLVVSTLPIANAGADATICTGSSTTLNGSASGGTAPYAFSWTPAAGLSNPAIATPTANPGITTTYTLTVTDAGGCIGTDQVVVTVNIPATASAGGPYAVCAGSSVAITATASGAGSWTAPPGTGTFLNATNAGTTFTPAPGQSGNSITLTWTTTDPDGPGPCPVVSSTASVTVNPPATATIIGTYTACSNAPVNIVATTNNNGTWSTNGSGTFANASSATTTYTPGASEPNNPVTITWTTIDPDGAGPCTSATVSTTIAVNPAATANAGGPYTTCGNGAVSITSSGSGAGVWSSTPGAGTFASTTNATTTFTPASATPGTISLTWTTNDPDGPGPCAAVSNSATLTVNAPATAATTGPYTACSNAPVTIAATTNSNGTWTSNGTGTFGSNTSANTTYTPGSGEPNNPVTVTWTTIDPDGPGPCTPATTSTAITINPAATANAGGPYTTCGNGAVSITSTGSGAGVWSTTPGAGTFASTTNATTTFTPASATPGTISLTWTTNDPDASGPCAAVSNSATLTVNEPATATINGPFIACSNAPVNIAATANSDGTWTTNGAGTFANSTNASTTYTPGVSEPNNPVTITWTTIDPDGTGPCTPATASNLITVNTAPTVSAGSDLTLCLNSGAITLDGTPDNGDWSGTGVSPSGAFNPVTVGVFDLTYTFTDANNCTNSDAMTVTVNDAATANANGPYTTCGTTTIALNATTNGTGQWTGGAGSFAIASSSTTTYTPDPSEVNTTITLTWETFDPDGTGPCPGASATALLTMNPPATVAPGGPYTICSSDEANVQVTTTPGGGTWTGGAGTIGSPNNSTTDYTPDPSEAGNTVVLTWTTVDPDGIGPCPAVSADVTVNVLEAAIAAANGPYATCGTDAIALNATTNGTGQWTGGIGSFADPSSTTTTYTPDLSEVNTSITLTWETFDPDGAGPCPGAQDEAQLTISTPATAIPGGPYTICSIDVASISVVTTPGGGAWTGGLGTLSTPINPLTDYTPASSEAGTTVLLSWTTVDPDGTGPCPAVSADVSVNVLEAAIAAANGPYATCGTEAIALNATTNGTGQWTGGAGTFADASNTTTTYTPAAGEVNSTITLTWETFDPDGAGPCPGADDEAELTITEPATAVAGGPYDVCSNSTVDVLVTTTPGAGLWSGGTGTILDPVNPVTTYTPAPAEAGTAVILTWTTVDPDGPGPCEPEVADVTVNVLEAAVAVANGPYAVCGAEAISLAATTNGTGEWSGGSGTYADASDPNTTYTPSLPEVGTSIQLTWSTFDPDGPGPCEGAEDSAPLTISEPATAIPDGPYDVCSNSSVEVSVSTTPGTGSWTGGSGTFLDATNPTTTYTPAPAEAGNTVILTWTTIDPDDGGPCPAVSAAVTVNVLAAASAEANGPYVTCGPDPVDINAIANGSGSWSGGVGSFGDAQNVITTYTADPSEFGNTITLTWTTNDPDGPGPCPDAADTAELLIHTLPIANAGLDLTLACGDVITGTATAGAGPDYTYSWSPTTGLITPNVAVTPVTGSGTYALLVTDANGCIDTDSVQVTVTGLETMAQTSDVEVCLFDAVDLQGNATDGLAPHTFTWTPAAYLTPPTGIGATVAFSYALPLTQDSLFTHVLQVVDAFGCADTDTLTVTVHPLPVVVVGADTSLCAYDPPFDLSGDPIGGTWDPASTVDPAVLAFGNNPFVYSYTDANNCTNTDELIVTVNEVPQADFTSPDTACVNSSVLFTNQSSCPTCTGIAYAWDFGDGSPSSALVSPQYTYTDTGLYVVRLIAGSGFGCSDTITRPIRIIKVPEVGFTFTPEIGCGPLVVDLTNTSLGLPINHLWTIETFGTSTLADPGPITFPAAPCDSTFYTLSLSASNQCGSVTAVDSVKVFSPPQPLLVVSADTVCSPFNLEAYNETECAWATTYAWNFGDGTGSNTQDLLVSHVYTADTVPETYTLTLSAQNVCGTVTATNSIVVYPNTVTAFFNTAPLVGCPPLPVQFTQSLLGITFWTWNFGDGNTSQDEDPLYVYDEEGTYAVNLIVSNGCAWDTMTQQVTVLSPPVFDFVAEPDTLCILQPTTFTPSGNNITGWSWDFGDGATSTLTTPTHAYAAAGEYQVALTAFSTTTGCPATVVHPVEVLITPVASITATPSQGCAPLWVQFGNGSTDAGFFIWDLGDGNTSSDSLPLHGYEGAGTYTAQVIASNFSGCADTTSVVITVFPVPVASFTYVMDTLPEPILPVAFENLSEGATGYQWAFGDGGTSTFVHPDHVYQIGGDCSYSPSLIAINQYNCRDTVVRILDVPRDLRIWAPNAFSPTDDGLNESFVIQGADIDLATATLSIFDRWGQLIHESKGPTPSWDGRVNGTLAKNDVYVWKLKARMSCGYDEMERIGHVTLVR